MTRENGKHNPIDVTHDRDDLRLEEIREIALKVCRLNVENMGVQVRLQEARGEQAVLDAAFATDAARKNGTHDQIAVSKANLHYIRASSHANDALAKRELIRARIVLDEMEQNEEKREERDA